MADLARSGYEVYVSAPKDDYSYLIEEKYKFIPLRFLHRSSGNVINNIRFFLELVGIYRRIKPGILVQYTIKPNIFGAFASRLVGVSNSVLFVCGKGHGFEKTYKYNRIVKALYAIALLLSEKAIFLNRNDYHDFSVLPFGSLNIKKLHLLPGEGVDVKHFRPCRNRAFSKSGRARMLYCGRLLKSKGLVKCIQALNCLKNQDVQLEIRVLGDIDPSNPDSITADELRSLNSISNVHFFGHIDDIRPHLEWADCLVHITEYGEGLSMAIMEAMASGISVLVSDNPGCEKLVLNSLNGFVVPRPVNMGYLAKTFESFAELDSRAKKEMGKRGRALIESRYSTSQVNTQLIEIVQSDS